MEKTMNNNTDHRDDLEYITSLFDNDGISAPDSLSEDSIMGALPDHSPVRENRRFAPRRWIALAACLMLVFAGSMKVYDIATAPPDTVTASGELYVFRNESEITKLVSSLDNSSSPLLLGGSRDAELEVNMVEDAEMASDGADMALSSDTGSAGAAEHSDTYLQVKGVDEADIVKTDGRYIYYVTDKAEVVILEASDGETHLLSRIGASAIDNYVDDIYINGDTLVTVGNYYEDDERCTGIVTYDISDRSDPQLIRTFAQTGSIVSSRMVGDYVYLVTSDRVYKGGRIAPMCSVDGEFREMAAGDIACVPEPSESSYIVLSAVDITSGKSSDCRTSAVFGASSDIYCNDHNLYSAMTEWDDDYESSYTRIVRASLDGLKVKFNATARVSGMIDDQFSMDEKDGYLRIATTSRRAGIDVNNLFVLDKDLKETGKVTGFARNESIKAVRYFGDKAYVITYEQIDPLFIIDLSDPASPNIEGEVMIDGFSTLLVPAGEGRLIGIGHATGDNGYGGEYAAGLKLALFDISDPSEPKVIASREFEDVDSPAQDTHKALTVIPGSGMYAVPYSIYHYESEYEAGVLVFGADDELTVYDQHSLADKYLPRCVSIGDYIYALDTDGNAYSFRPGA